VTDSGKLFAAIRSDDLAQIAQLLEAEPKLMQARNEQGVSAVMMACYMGRKDIRDLLLSTGALLELNEAAAAGQLPRVREIVSQDSQAATSFSSDGFPVMALAAAFGHLGVVTYLCEKGADVNAVSRNGTGYTALTGAVAGSHASIVNWLAEYGADVNHRYAQGHSPLLEAAANGRLDIVKTLVAHGAEVQVRNDAGKSALNFAEEREHKDVALYLRELGLAS
jgi:ankyrin repeat protein